MGKWLMILSKVLNKHLDSLTGSIAVGHSFVTLLFITLTLYRDVIISQLTDEFLNVVDNIINVDVETLQESQESSNTSAM